MINNSHYDNFYTSRSGVLTLLQDGESRDAGPELNGDLHRRVAL
jgi:hypothetical protein